jgi:hypothetical protein
MKIKGSNFYLDLVTLFRGLTHLNSRISTKKFKISNNTQRFLQHSSSESLIYRPLHHTMKIVDFKLFWISSLFSWANTFKTQEF